MKIKESDIKKFGFVLDKIVEKHQGSLKDLIMKMRLKEEERYLIFLGVYIQYMWERFVNNVVELNSKDNKNETKN